MNAVKLKKRLAELRARQSAPVQEPPENKVCNWCEIEGDCHCKLKFSVSQNTRLNSGAWR